MNAQSTSIEFTLEPPIPPPLSSPLIRYKTLSTFSLALSGLPPDTATAINTQSTSAHPKASPQPYPNVSVSGV